MEYLNSRQARVRASEAGAIDASLASVKTIHLIGPTRAILTQHHLSMLYKSLWRRVATQPAALAPPCMAVRTPCMAASYIAAICFSKVLILLTYRPSPQSCVQSNNDMLTRAAATSALSSQAPALLACAAHVSFLHICAAIAPGKIVHVPFPHWETWKVLSPSSPPCNVLSAGLSSALRRP